MAGICPLLGCEAVRWHIILERVSIKPKDRSFGRKNRSFENSPDE
jgi:hypothetical protein